MVGALSKRSSDERSDIRGDLSTVPAYRGACHPCASAIALVAGAHSRDPLAHAGYFCRSRDIRDDADITPDIVRFG
jgi:hypothetical protein